MNEKKMPLYSKLYIIGGVMLAVILLLALPFTLPLVNGYKVLRVESNSMEPTYPVGGIIYIKEVVDYSELSVGTVISYTTDSGSNMLTTHRIVEVNDNGSYITKGDNNKENDLYAVTFERIEGKVVMGISGLGYIAPLFQNTFGRIFLFVLVAVAVGFWILGDYLKKQDKKNRIEEGEVIEEEETKNGPTFKHDYVMIGLICIGLGLICFGGSKIININVDNNKSKELYQSIEKQFVTTDSSQAASEKKDDTSSTASNGKREPDEKKEWYELVTVDMESLCSYNKDAVAWLYFEDGSISYPVMYSGDNTTYYRHNISGDYDDNGAIFIEASNRPNFSDSNTLVYGHNMNSLAMFGKLKNYRLNNDYYETHQYYQMITKDKIYRYRIFAYEEVKETSDLFTVYKSAGSGFDNFLSSVKSLSYISPDFEVTGQDKVITMVTCNGVKGERFLVHAILVETYEINK